MRIIAGYLKGRKLLQPSLRSTRPTSERVRESIFNIINHQLNLRHSDYESLNTLDMFAGSGAMGFEALSRGCGHVTMIDNHPDAIKTLAANVDQLGVRDKVNIIRTNAANLKATRRQYSLIFLDPPYAQNLIPKMLRILDDNDWLADQALIICEYGPNDINDVAINAEPSIVDQDNTDHRLNTHSNGCFKLLSQRRFNHCCIEIYCYNKLD